MTEDMIEYVKQNKTYVLGATALIIVMMVGAVFSQVSTMTAGNSASQELTRQQFAASGDYAAKPASLTRGGDGGGAVDVEKKIITTYSLSFEVQNVRSAIDETSRLAEDYSGWVDSEHISSYDQRDSGSITVRIPSNNVSEFLEETEANSWELQSRNKNTDDVTDRYTELKLELRNKRQELRQLEQMMNRTEDVENLIKIQERMSEIRSRVQYLENQMINIDQRVDYTRIQISFEEPEPITAELELRDTFGNAYEGVFQSLKFIIVGTGYLLPFALIGALIHFGRKRLKGRD